MQFDRKSRIIEIWRHPVGQDLLRGAMSRLNKPEDWPASALAASARVGILDKLVNPEFTDRLLEVVNLPCEPPAEPAAAPAWWKEAVGYQIYVPSFMDSDHDGVGDIGGVVQRLPYLENLGVTLLWISCTDLAGIDCADPTAACVPEDDASIEALDTLLAAAHERGMKVIASLSIPVLAKVRQWLEAPAGGELRQNLTRMLNFWRGRGIDGFCFEGVRPGEREAAARGLPMDVAAFTPALHEALRFLREKLEEEGGPLLLVGGVDGIGPENAKLFTAPCRAELDMVLDTCHLHTPPGLFQMLRKGKNAGAGKPGPLALGKTGPSGISLARLKNYYLRWMAGNGEGYWMPIVFETPESPRIISRVGGGPVYRTVLAKLFATWMFTLRGTPLLFQGEELGLANTRFSSPEEIRDELFRVVYGLLKETMDDKAAFDLAQRMAADNARTPMPWSTGAGAGFTGAMPWRRLPDGVEHLNAAYQMGDTASVWNHYHALARLRRDNPGLVYGSFNPVFVKNKRVLCYFRMYEGKKWYVEINLTGGEVTRPGRVDAGHTLLLSNYGGTAKRLRSYEANLYKVDG